MQRAIIIGGGPAGLTAAIEFLKTTDIKPIVIEQSNNWGGLSQTVNYNGNRIDIGGHRFFSKSDKVMKWWLDILPIHRENIENLTISYQNKSHDISSVIEESGKEMDKDKVMLVRRRKSRIYYKRKFFEYPITLNTETISKLGYVQTALIGLSYFKSILSPIKPENNLEEFYINRFGKKLYSTFFRSYTEKVWGIPCREISAEWGAQRVKGLSISKAITHYLKKILKLNDNGISQKQLETSLIEYFLYPKFGPGQMWEEAASIIEKKGGELYRNLKVTGINIEKDKIVSITTQNALTNQITEIKGEYFLSTMPIKDLINSFNITVPGSVKEISDGLIYRDFITVGLLVNRLKVGDIADNWIYIQEPEVKVGRLQIFNNWSPYLVNNPDNTVWIGMEYFCNIGDELWGLTDKELKELAIKELSLIDIINKEDVIDAVVLRMPKTYPAYFGTYNRFSELKDYLSLFENLFLIGRNGMHKYNNQDHSMLTAMQAVDNIKQQVTTKDNIWSINTEMEYHEGK